ncbi:MAG TPA: helix-turn-helix domain-containing protein [Burkholderiaceae bacterium]
MSQDRAHADSFPATQELLAYRLGVRRVSIATAASALQRGGLIARPRAAAMPPTGWPTPHLL